MLVQSPLGTVVFAETAPVLSATSTVMLAPDQLPIFSTPDGGLVHEKQLSLPAAKVDSVTTAVELPALQAKPPPIAVPESEPPLSGAPPDATPPPCPFAPPVARVPPVATAPPVACVVDVMVFPPV